MADDLLAYIPHPRMAVIDIQAMSDEDIEKAIGLGELRSAFMALKHAHDKEFFKHNMGEVTKFVHENDMTPKELFDTYIHMLYEYMQRRSELDNEQFREVVEQSNSEEMVTEFKTIFQSAKEDGITIGEANKLEAVTEAVKETTRTAIKGFIQKTRLSDAVIADTLDVSVELVKTIREEVKAAKAATPKKTAKAAKSKPSKS